MISSDVRDDHLIGRRKPEKIGVENQMIRMLVVAFVADMVAAIVEQRRIGQHAAILAWAAKPLAERVEQCERELANMRRVWLLDVTALREIIH